MLWECQHQSPPWLFCSCFSECCLHTNLRPTYFIPPFHSKYRGPGGPQITHALNHRNSILERNAGQNSLNISNISGLYLEPALGKLGRNLDLFSFAFPLSYSVCFPFSSNVFSFTLAGRRTLGPYAFGFLIHPSMKAGI